MIRSISGCVGWNAGVRILALGVINYKDDNLAANI